MNILEDLWYGHLCPIANDGYRNDDYTNLLTLHDKNEAKLLSTLSDTQKGDLKIMQETVEEMRNIAECNAFITGFRLAVQIMTASVDT